MFAELLADSLRADGHEAVLGDPEELDDDGLVALAAAAASTVVVLDLLLGPRRSGMSLITRFVETGARVIVLTAASEPDLHAAAFRAGAAAIVEKLTPLDHFAEVLDAVSNGADLAMDPPTWVSYREVGVGDVDGLEQLTPRERDVLAGLLAGRSAKDIAADLGVAVPTVRTQLSAIYRKLGVGNQRSAILVALRGGWRPTL